MASMRYERRIAASANDVWNIVRRPESIPHWFPGIVSCTVEGNLRTITTASGVEMPEEILTIDPQLRRFVYRMTAPIYEYHLGVIDVIELAVDDSLCVYSTNASPDPLALIMGAGTSGALDEIKRQAELGAKE